jgi:hypothetical protein
MEKLKGKYLRNRSNFGIRCDTAEEQESRVRMERVGYSFIRTRKRSFSTEEFESEIGRPNTHRKIQMQGTAKAVYGFLAGVPMNIPVFEAFLFI